jgi:serine/threonine protein kinase
MGRPLRAESLIPPDRLGDDAPAVSVLGRHRIVGVLGHGGMGVVYRAQDPVTGEEVAIKTVRSRHESDVAGLRREIAALWRLRQPGVVRILEDGTFHGCPWFAMELLRGRSLRRLTGELWARASVGGHPGELTTTPRVRTRIDDSTVSGAPISAAVPPLRLAASTVRAPAAAGRLAEVLRLIQRLCGTLAHVHQAGYVHRDLKPTNVLLQSDGSPVLLDFGLVSRFAGARAREALEPAGARVGTIHYTAPEQIRGELVDARADLYSVGCLLFELVTGQRPFEAASADQVAQQQLAAQPPLAAALVAGVPAELDALLRRLLAKDPRQRTMHADDVAEELGRLAGETATSSPAHLRRVTAPYFFRPGIAGRGSTLAEIDEAIADGASGRGAVLLFTGERGMGKTTVLAHAARQGTLFDYRVVTARCLPGQDPSLHPLASLVRVASDRCRKGASQATRRLLAERLPVLASLEPSVAWDPREVDIRPLANPGRQEVLASLVETACALAEDQRLLLAVDDLHQADALTLGFLAALAPERLARSPLIVVGSYRPQSARAELEAAIAATGARRLPLGPLSEPALAAVVGDLLGLGRTPLALVKLMDRRAHGNPARVIEALREAAADGLVVRRGGRWVVEGEPPRGFWLRRTLRAISIPSAS